VSPGGKKYEEWEENKVKKYKRKMKKDYISRDTG
jgi:hypothetical protein